MLNSPSSNEGALHAILVMSDNQLTCKAGETQTKSNKSATKR